MIERLENVGSTHWADILAVLVPNGTVVALINLAELNHFATFILTTVSLAFTVWRWRQARYAGCQKCWEGQTPSVCPVPRNRRPWWCPKSL